VGFEVQEEHFVDLLPRRCYVLVMINRMESHDVLRMRPARPQLLVVMTALSLASACGVGDNEAGSGFMAAAGGCFEISGAHVEIPPQESFYIGGADFGISPSGGLDDVLRIKNDNTEAESVVIIRSSDGDLDIDNADADKGDNELALRPGDIRHFRYEEETGYIVEGEVHQGEGSMVMATIDQSCP
jgi:hypothetical protein